MRAGLFLEALSRRHAVTVVIVPVLAGPAPAGELVRRFAQSCSTLELTGPDEDRAFTTSLLSTRQGRARAGLLYPLPGLCPRPSASAASDLRSAIDRSQLVHVMRSYLLPCVDTVLDAQRRPVLTVDLDELDSAVHRQLGNPEEAERYERLERYYAPRVDHLFTASAEDARIVSREYGATSVSAVVNAVRAPAQLPAAAQIHDLLFVGNLSYAPNVDAAQWLCREIRPLLGGATIALVGSRPAAQVKALGELPGVTVAADVPDVTPWYLASRVAVAPLRLGGGTRTKIVEALVHGRPVVATELGASGLDVGEPFGVLTANGAEGFAAHTLGLLRDPVAAARIGAAGRRHVKTADEVVEEIDRQLQDVAVRLR
jgi:glycosyltransferase involved in cell wall biosynthesis